MTSIYGRSGWCSIREVRGVHLLPRDGDVRCEAYMLLLPLRCGRTTIGMVVQRHGIHRATFSTGMRFHAQQWDAFGVRTVEKQVGSPDIGEAPEWQFSEGGLLHEQEEEVHAFLGIGVLGGWL